MHLIRRMAVVGEILDLKKGNHKTFELLFKKVLCFSLL